MRIILLATIVISLVLPISAQTGAIRYEFQQITKTDPPTDRAKVIVGSVYLHQGMSRVDYSPASTSGAGTWVIARNGGRNAIYVDPESKTYLVHSSPELSESLRGVQLQISNLKLDTRNLGTGPVIAGYPTDHFRITATYDVSISLGPIPLVQHVQTVIDKWTTQAFGDVGSNFFGGKNIPHSGDPGIDRLIEAETTEAPGFPLRQVTTITTNLSDRNLPKSSEIQVQRSRRQTTEMLVSKVGRADPNPALFQIPAGFKPVDQSSLLGDTGTFQNLTPEPVQP